MFKWFYKNRLIDFSPTDTYKRANVAMCLLGTRLQIHNFYASQEAGARDFSKSRI